MGSACARIRCFADSSGSSSPIGQLPATSMTGGASVKQIRETPEQRTEQGDGRFKPAKRSVHLLLQLSPLLLVESGYFPLQQFVRLYFRQ